MPTTIARIKEKEFMNNKWSELFSEKGFRVRYFREYSEKCLAGEDLEFIENYMAKGETTIFNPAPIEDLFKGEELLDDIVSLPAGKKAS